MEGEEVWGGGMWADCPRSAEITVARAVTRQTTSTTGDKFVN